MSHLGDPLAGGWESSLAGKCYDFYNISTTFAS